MSSGHVMLQQGLSLADPEACLMTSLHAVIFSTRLFILALIARRWYVYLLIGVVIAWFAQGKLNIGRNALVV